MENDFLRTLEQMQKQYYRPTPNEVVNNYQNMQRSSDPQTLLRKYGLSPMESQSNSLQKNAGNIAILAKLFMGA